MKTVKLERCYSWVIILDEQSIRRIYSEMFYILNEKNDQNQFIKITIEYTNKISITTNSIDDVFTQENRAGIKNLILEGKFDKKRIKITFGGKNNDINLQIFGPDNQWVYVAKSIIEEKMKNFKETKPRTGMIIFLSYICYTLLIYLLFPYYNGFLPILTKINQNGEHTLEFAGLIFGFSYIFLFILISIVIFKLYPNSIYLIGPEIKRHEKRLNIRTNLFWVVIIGLFISVISGIALKVFGR